MLDHARNLEFEKAAEARDRLGELRRNFFGASPEDEEPASASARRSVIDENAPASAAS